MQVTPVLDEEQLEKAVRPILLEFMEHGNCDEVEVGQGQFDLVGQGQFWVKAG